MGLRPFFRLAFSPVAQWPLPQRVHSLGTYAAMKSIVFCCVLIPAIAQGNDPEMLWADASNGRPFSKDPSVIRFGEGYLLYYSLPAETGWTLGIARSTNLVHWEKVGVVLPGAGCEQRGIAAPAACTSPVRGADPFFV